MRWACLKNIFGGSGVELQSLWNLSPVPARKSTSTHRSLRLTSECLATRAGRAVELCVENWTFEEVNTLLGTEELDEANSLLTSIVSNSCPELEPVRSQIRRCQLPGVSDMRRYKRYRVPRVTLSVLWPMLTCMREVRRSRFRTSSYCSSHEVIGLQTQIIERLMRSYLILSQSSKTFGLFAFFSTYHLVDATGFR